MSRHKRISNVVSRFLARFDYFLMFLGFAYLGIYAYEVLAEPTQQMARILENGILFIYCVFIADLAARAFVALPEFKQLGGWIEFVSHNWLSIVAVFVPSFRTLRVLRVLLVLRGLSPFLKSRASKVGLIVGVTLPLTLFTSALSIYEVERYAEGSNITTFGDAIWWSAVSVTTVGYGDAFPVTSEGRLVASFLMFIGIGLFSSITALIAAWVVEGNRNTK
jgi:voltage-gated potassium channel